MNKTEKAIYKQRAEVLKAIAHPIRLAIIDLLAGGEKTVGLIVRRVGSTQSNVSKHLSLLKHCGIIDDRKIGLNRFYYLKIPCAKQFSICVIETVKARHKQLHRS